MWHRDNTLAWVAPEAPDGDGGPPPAKVPRMWEKPLQLLSRDAVARLVEKSDETLLRYHDARKWVEVDGCCGTDSVILSRFQDFFRNGVVHCKLCRDKLSVNGYSGNLGKHERSEKHKAKGDGKKQAPLPFARAGGGGGATDPARSEHEKRLRALTTASLVGAGINPHQIGTAFSKDAITAKAFISLYNSRVWLGTAGTMDRDLDIAVEAVDSEIKRRVAGAVGSIAIDGATFRHMGAYAIIINEASGEFDSVPPDFVMRVQQLETVWQICARDGSAVLSTAIARAFPDANAPLKAGLNTRFKGEVQAMAEASLAAYRAHVSPMMALLERRAFYMPRSGVHTDAMLANVSNKAFIGAEAFEFGVNVVAQAEQYVQEMVRLRRDDPSKLTKINTCEFWVSRKRVWPDLVPIALYWTAFPTSSVSVERAFARLRAMDEKTRACMTH